MNNTQSAPQNATFIAHVWEYPELCIGLFGVQYQTDEGRRLYEESGIGDDVMRSLPAAAEDGLLHARPLMSQEGQIVMVYWRSYEDLDRWARKQPHSGWWKWLVQNAGNGVSFYHEIYQIKCGEAIYEKGSLPVGPAAFCSTEAVRSGEGKSRERQQKFAETAFSTNEDQQDDL
ncbi:MAG: hypothetical protein OHK0029_30120 [Armatimonadaceae bacterium]